MTIRDEFSVHILNADGIAAAQQIAETFSHALIDLEIVCGADGREMALVRTHLQQAAFFAKRAMAVRVEYQRSDADAPFVPHELDRGNVGTADHWRERARVAEAALAKLNAPVDNIGPSAEPHPHETSADAAPHAPPPPKPHHRFF